MKGGVINMIEGEVTGGRDGIAGQSLKPNQQLEKGYVVQVGGGGRAEILLNPGYYLRLSKDTQAAFLNLSRENLKVKISHGSAIIEVLEIPDPSRTFGPSIPAELLGGIYQPITIVTPQGEFATITGGVYRFDVSANGTTDLKVAKGLAVVAGDRVKGGMRATLRNGRAALMKFDKDFSDAFDNWSRERAALLVKTNKSLRNTQWSKHLRKKRSSYLRIEDDERRERAKEQFTVSAIGGFVSSVEDGVVFMSGESEWERLSDGADLRYGDRVRTGEDSRVEILLYPACYLHLSSNTEIIYSERPDGGAAVKLLRGSAIVTSELEGKDQALVTFVAPQAEYEIVRKGVYRLNVMQGDKPEMIVYEGRVRVKGSEIKGGQKVVLQDAGLALFPISKRGLDSFDIWSRKRAASLLATDEWVKHLMADFRRERAYFGGMWFFDQASGAYTFVPGIWDFRSPYGEQYSTKFWGHR
jgi:hypothetical protein